MSKPTAAEIESEIAALTECKTYVPKLTNLGFDNHAGFDAMIAELKVQDLQLKHSHPQQSSVIDKLIAEANSFRLGFRAAPSLDYASWKA